MRRFIEQIIVDAAELTGMFAEALLFGLPLALNELAQNVEPYLVEIVCLGGLLWILFW